MHTRSVRQHHCHINPYFPHPWQRYPPTLKHTHTSWAGRFHRGRLHRSQSQSKANITKPQTTILLLIFLPIIWIPPMKSLRSNWLERILSNNQNPFTNNSCQEISTVNKKFQQKNHQIHKIHVPLLVCQGSIFHCSHGLHIHASLIICFAVETWCNCK